MTECLCGAVFRGGKKKIPGEEFSSEINLAEPVKKMAYRKYFPIRVCPQNKNML